MDILNVRTWLFFYLICFVAVLWATFLLVKGAMLWIAATLFIVVLGFNFILITSEIRQHRARKEMMKRFSESAVDTKAQDRQGR
jgi:Flp pilus assembly protein TadB